MDTIQNKQYLTIRPGETAVIKKNAKILSVINYGGVQYTAPCFDLQSLEQTANCYSLSWSTAAWNGSGSDANPLYDTMINFISVLGVQYDINKSGDFEIEGTGGSAQDKDKLQDFLISTIPQGLLRIFDLTVFSDQNSHRHTYSLHFQTTTSVAETIEMKISELPNSGQDAGFVNGLYIRPVLSSGNCGDTPQT